jgi:hypothetical protein
MLMIRVFSRFPSSSFSRRKVHFSQFPKRKFPDARTKKNGTDGAKQRIDWGATLTLAGFGYFAFRLGSIANLSFNPSDWFPERRVDLNSRSSTD